MGVRSNRTVRWIGKKVRAGGMDGVVREMVL